MSVGVMFVAAVGARIYKRADRLGELAPVTIDSAGVEASFAQSGQLRARHRVVLGFHRLQQAAFKLAIALLALIGVALLHLFLFLRDGASGFLQRGADFAGGQQLVGGGQIFLRGGVILVR